MNTRRNENRLIRLSAWIGATCVVMAVGMGGTVAPAENVYSPGGWSTLHRGPANRKQVADLPRVDAYRTWATLEGAAVLTAPTVSPDGRTFYVTTGRAQGFANLHAYRLPETVDAMGEAVPVWQAQAWSSPDQGVDPCAVLSSPIVDRDGVIFIGDCNQLFAFEPDGKVKWVAPLPPFQEGDWRVSETLPVNALTTAVFTKHGLVFGVTNFGDLVLVDRETGKSRAPAMRLPGLLPPEVNAVPMPDAVFGEGLLDPEIRLWAWQLLMGGAMRSANTPGVNLETGRIFVAATSVNPGRGALYGIDLVPRGDAFEIEIAFATDMGLGSGSSPSLSPSGHRVYVSDEEGVFYSVDANTGTIEWQVETKATAAAAAVGANGDIFALQAFGPSLIAITEEGQVRWQSEMQHLADARLPASWLLGEPVAMGNGNPTVLDEVVLVPVVYGYETHWGRRIPWPVSSSLVAVDLETGVGLRDVVSLEDDSTGVTAVLPNGTILSSLGTALTSGVRALSRLEWMLPGKRRLLPARGGLQVSIPVDPDALGEPDERKPEESK